MSDLLTVKSGIFRLEMGDRQLVGMVPQLHEKIGIVCHIGRDRHPIEDRILDVAGHHGQLAEIPHYERQKSRSFAKGNGGGHHPHSVLCRMAEGVGDLQPCKRSLQRVMKNENNSSFRQSE